MKARKYMTTETLRLVADIHTALHTRRDSVSTINALQALMLMLDIIASAYVERELSAIEYLLVTKALFLGHDVARALSLKHTAEAIDAVLTVATQHRPLSRVRPNGNSM